MSATRTIIMQYSAVYPSKQEDEQRLDIPISAEVTFELLPTGERNTKNYRSILTVWAGPAGSSPKLGTFIDVLAWRDSTIGLRKLVHREGGKSIWQSDEHGLTQESHYTRTRALVSADELEEN